MNFFIYPQKDTTIYKKRKIRFLNSGSDEVIELTNIFTEAEGHDVSRILIQFDVKNIINIKNELKDAKYILNLKVMMSSELLDNDIITCYPVSKEWVEGTGRFVPSSDAKKYTLGANWKYTDGETNMWSEGSHYDATGGGTWYDTEICLDDLESTHAIDNEFKFNKSFSDVKLDVTEIVNYWITESIPNYGFLLKFKNEATNSNSGNVKFYSSDTNTIYTPFLQIKQNDYDFNPCKKVTKRKFSCVEHHTPTPCHDSGTFFSGSLDSGSYCSGSHESGSIIESGSLNISEEDTIKLVDYNEKNVKTGTLDVQVDDVTKVVFTECSENYVNNGETIETDYEINLESVTGNLKQVEGPDLIPHIKRIKKEYRRFSRERISVGIREKYPQKTFSNKSEYSLNNFTLDCLKYSVRDAETEEELIEFDDYSKISCDSTGHYFNFDFGCLPAGRVYKFLLLIESEYGDFLHEDNRRFIVRV